jgi:hypothetical protein
VQPQPWRALAAWQKLIDREPLADADGIALAELVRVRDDDDLPQRLIRETLFTASWQLGTQLGVVA